MTRRIAAVIVICAAVAANAFADSVIRVVRATSSSTQAFKCGERCRFRANAPQVPLRLRVFRGTKAKLSRTGTDPRYVNVTGCVEYSSMIVRAQDPPRRQNVLDLRFFFKPHWLSGQYDGEFVFVIEYDDNPRGPRIEEKPARLRLAANMTDEYFGSGIDVTIKAPLHARVRLAAAQPPELESVMMAMPDDELPPPPPLPAPEPVRTLASNDCASVRIDPGPPVLIQRTDAGDTAEHHSRSGITAK